MQNGTDILEHSMTVSYKTNHTLTILSSNCAPWYLPKEVEGLCPHKHRLYMDVYCSFIYNYPNLEATRCLSGGEWINKLWYIQTMEYYLVLKINELSIH